MQFFISELRAVCQVGAFKLAVSWFIMVPDIFVYNLRYIYYRYLMVVLSL